MSDLPKSWVLVSLEDVGAITTGGTPPTSNPGYYGGLIPFVKPGDLDQRLPITQTKQTVTPEGAQHANLLAPGAVLVSCIGNLGKVGIAGAPLVTNQQINAITFNPELVDQRYGFRYCATLKPWMEAEASATTITILNKRKFGKAPFKLAPLREQSRLINKLDRLLERVDSCLDRLDRAPQILKRFREAVLEAAVSGKLTEEWRANRAQNESGGRWKQLPLSDLCLRGSVITYGVIKLGADIPEGVPCLRTSNVRWLRIDIEGIKRIDPALSAEYSRTILKGSEVLVNVRGTLGGVAAVGREMYGWNVSREVAVVPVDSDLVEKSYLALWIASTTSQRWLQSVQKGVAYTGINIEDLRNLPVSAPSLPEQREIVRRVNELFAFADSIERQCQAATAKVEKLTPSLLAKAFRGELVRQDPNDEPASTLLERIRQGRKEAETIPRRVKRTTTEKASAEAPKLQAKRGVKRKPQKVAARTGSPMSKPLSSKRK